MGFKILSNLVSVFWQLCKYPIILLLILIGVFILLIIAHIVIGLIKCRRFLKGVHNFPKKRNIFLRLFYDFPKRVCDDMFAKNPEFFRFQGCIIFCGRQGQGKTASMIQFIRTMQEEYPLCKCITNVGYTNQDGELSHWKQLLSYKNGIQGVIAAIDETQNWFSSKQSKDFPPEMLEVITQNRKNRRIILGTSQNFYLLAKAIRSQATEIRQCSTWLGCLTIVRKFEPLLDNEGNVTKLKSRVCISLCMIEI